MQRRGGTTHPLKQLQMAGFLAAVIGAALSSKWEPEQGPLEGDPEGRLDDDGNGDQSEQYNPGEARYAG